MSCQFLLYSKVNQLYRYIYPLFFRFFSHIGHYRVLSRVPCAIQQVLISYLFFFNSSLLEYNCFTILCQFLLYNKANQPYAYTCPHIHSLLSLPPILPIPPLQVIAKHQADLPVLWFCFPPANYFTFGSVYMSILLSLRPSFALPPHVIKSIIYVYLFIPALQLGSSVPFFFLMPYICALALGYSICFSLSDFTLFDRLQVHPPHYK